MSKKPRITGEDDDSADISESFSNFSPFNACLLPNPIYLVSEWTERDSTDDRVSFAIIIPSGMKTSSCLINVSKGWHLS